MALQLCEACLAGVHTAEVVAKEKQPQFQNKALREKGSRQVLADKHPAGTLAHAAHFSSPLSVGLLGDIDLSLEEFPKFLSIKFPSPSWRTLFHLNFLFVKNMDNTEYYKEAIILPINQTPK